MFRQKLAKNALEMSAAMDFGYLNSFKKMFQEKEKTAHTLEGGNQAAFPLVSTASKAKSKTGLVSHPSSSASHPTSPAVSPWDQSFSLHSNHVTCRKGGEMGWPTERRERWGNLQKGGRMG